MAPLFLYTLQFERNAQMKVFISQPMGNKTEEHIKQVRDKAIEWIKNRFGDDTEIIDSYIENAPVDAKPLWFLGKSIELLSTADFAVFVENWYDCRGCYIEMNCCACYNIPFDTLDCCYFEQSR